MREAVAALECMCRSRKESAIRNSRLFSAVALLAFSAIGASGCATVHAHPSPPSARVTVVTFYDALSPYGDWIFVPGFGRVWRPWQHVVGFGFVPYASGGRWEYTSVGWVFESDWPWGGIAFHYGRWFYLHGEGWLWAPDTVWGPAWVDWRFGGGDACLVALPPPPPTVVGPGAGVGVNAAPPRVAGGAGRRRPRRARGFRRSGGRPPIPPEGSSPRLIPP